MPLTSMSCRALSGAAGSADAELAGNRTVKVVPLPSSLLTVMAPLWPRTMPRTAAIPNPRPVNFVVKKVKESARVSWSMPQPVSATSRTT